MNASSTDNSSSSGGVATTDGRDASTGPDTRAEPPIVQPVSSQVTVETVAGSDVRGSVEGIGTAAQFDNPVGVIIEASGSLLVTEYDGYRLRRIDPTGATSTVTTGLPQPFALVATVDAIYIQTDRDENAVTGESTGTIWRANPAGGPPEVVISNLGRPRGLAVLEDGRIVLSDRTRHTISILDPATKSLTPLAGSGAPGFADGRGADARFNDPYGVAVLPDRNIVVADYANHCIRKITLDGQVSLFAGDRKPGMKDDADKYKARFDGPGDVAADAFGNVFVSDRGNHRIRRISPAGIVETVAGDGTQGFADGSGSRARFFGQEQLDVSADGRAIYVTDGSIGEDHPFHRVRRINVP